MANFTRSNLNFFKGNSKGDGFASQFTFNKRDTGEVVLFLEMAKQAGQTANGNATFGWRNSKNAQEGSSITIKLGNADIGEILAVISGRKKAVGVEGGKFSGLFHKNSKGSSTVDFKLYEKDGKEISYSLSVSNKVGDSQATRMFHSVTFGEAENLRVFLQQALVHMNNWMLKDNVTVIPDEPVVPDDNPL